MNEILFVEIPILSFDRFLRRFHSFVVKSKVRAKSHGSLDEESLWRAKREHFLAYHSKARLARPIYKVRPRGTHRVRHYRLPIMVVPRANQRAV